MNWVAWRQHRKQFMIAGIFFALFAAFMIPTGLSFWHTYQHARLTCGKTNTCGQLSGELFQSQIDGILLHLVPVAIHFVPLILGLFWGAPFLAREYAEGTDKLVWTQSVSRKKWLTIKLVWILAGAAITAAAFSALSTWWSRTGNALNLNRFEDLAFASQGFVPVAYAIFAVAVGVAMGAWFKRTMVALGTTLFLFMAIVLIIVPNAVRPHYEAPLNYKMSLASADLNGPLTSSNGPPTGATLTVSQTVVSSKNVPLNWANPPSKCVVTNLPDGNPIPTGHTVAVKASAQGNGEPKPIMSQNGGPAVDLDCLQALGYQMDIKYQPSYRFWDFQRIETGLYLALSVIPIGATYWLVLKRDA